MQIAKKFQKELAPEGATRFNVGDIIAPSGIDIERSLKIMGYYMDGYKIKYTGTYWSSPGTIEKRPVKDHMLEEFQKIN